jgi:hypothetical protein
MNLKRPLALLFAAAGILAAQATPTTTVLTTLTVKSDTDRAQMMKTMPDEVKATVKLYLDGKIQQWYSRADGKGVVFLLNCTSISEAKAITDSLPLSKAGFATFEYMPLGPLSPLRVLIGESMTPSKP